MRRSKLSLDDEDDHGFKETGFERFKTESWFFSRNVFVRYVSSSKYNITSINRKCKCEIFFLCFKKGRGSFVIFERRNNLTKKWPFAKLISD